MRVIAYTVGPLDNNTCVVLDADSGEAVIVDPSFESARIWHDVERNGWKLVAVLNTHAHLDHVVENALFVERSGAPLALHAGELPILHSLPLQAARFGVETPRSVEPARLLADGDSIAIGNGALRVLHTPGHTPGGISFLGKGFVIAGDVLFAGSIGRTDLPGGDMNQLLNTIRSRLLSLPDETVVYPGHGPQTTIGRERRTNPFL
jgi:hydroxyacylglutathione hydrolase